MSLINCPECGKEVSSKAPACVGCGSPISSVAPGSGESLSTIQETGKTLKMHSLVSAIMFFGGALVAFSAEAGPAMVAGGVVSLVGFVW